MIIRLYIFEQAYFDIMSLTFMFEQADFHAITFMFEQADFDVGLSLLEGQIKHQGGLISCEQNIFIPSPNGLT